MTARQDDAGTIKIDDLDIDILRSLNENARKSFRDIAKELHISLTTVSNRVKALERNGVIQGYIPVLDATKLGYDIMVVIGIKVIHGKIVETERDLAKENGVFAGTVRFMVYCAASPGYSQREVPETLCTILSLGPIHEKYADRFVTFTWFGDSVPLRRMFLIVNTIS